LVTTDIASVSSALAAGAVVGIPTDTVYGLAAIVGSDEALAQIFELKGRPADLALPVLIAGLDQAESFIGRSDRRLSELARRFWPGALTVVVSADSRPPSGLGGDGESVGLRCPADDAVRRLCRLAGPLAVTSANRHGEAPITTAPELEAVFGDLVDPVLDGGTRNGVPSSVVSIVENDATLLRSGPIAWSEILSVLEGVPSD
jgi:L-threonylcarbamoyladenylate synthase